MIFENCVSVMLYKFLVVTKRPSNHHHNEMNSSISNIEMFRNAVHILDVELIC